MECKQLFFKAELRRVRDKVVITIPNNFIGELGLENEGIVDMTISKAKLAMVPTAMANVYRKHIHCMSKMSDREISILLDIYSREKVTGKAGLAEELGISGQYAEFIAQLAKADTAEMKNDLEKAGK